jgi:hypothetical protein
MNRLVFIFLLFTFQNGFAQNGVWTWLSGTNTINSLGVFGMQGVPSINNHPPGLYECLEWKDKLGNFWMYGGGEPFYSDLWKFNPITKEWTWMKGNGLINQAPIHGIKGISNPQNSPGYRYASITWVDTAGVLWLFGGGYYNDLWKYEISTNEWTWISGMNYSNAGGNHGIKGVPSINNFPGGRSETSTGWIDTLNNLWLFGGSGYDDGGGFGRLNDLMRYEISTNEWTWMSGSATPNDSGYYGIKGVSNINNVPSARLSYTHWKDNLENFWLMGGGFPTFLNDLWKYEITTNQWTWISGTPSIGDSGVYGANCFFDTVNIPASRYEHRSAITDQCGRFWLFGGAVYTVLTTTSKMNDLWVFDPQLEQWNLINGTNIVNSTGSYGNLGVPSLSNLPPARMGAVSWWGDDNKFYLFGGSRAPYPSCFSDVWQYSPDTNCLSICNNISSSYSMLVDVPFISVSPIPTSLMLSVCSSISILNLKIFDLVGKELTIVKVLNNKVEIDVRFLSNGIYFLQVQTEKGSVVKRFIKE